MKLEDFKSVWVLHRNGDVLCVYHDKRTAFELAYIYDVEVTKYDIK